MNAARLFDTDPPARRDPRRLITLGILFAQSLIACGSSDAGFSAAGFSAAGSAAQTSLAGALVTAGASSASAGRGGASAPGGGSNGGAASGDGGAASGNGGAPSSNGGAASGIGGSKNAVAGTGGSADACSAADACASCLCKECPTEVKSCESTPGCQTIADCVASSRCEGIACYCGSSDAVTCATGNANGACRDVILNAPGGHKPTLVNQSAGPAADAAIAVGNCANKNQACTASCQ